MSLSLYPLSLLTLSVSLYLPWSRPPLHLLNLGTRDDHPTVTTWVTPFDRPLRTCVIYTLMVSYRRCAVQGLVGPRVAEKKLSCLCHSDDPVNRSITVLFWFKVSGTVDVRVRDAIKDRNNRYPDWSRLGGYSVEGPPTPQWETRGYARGNTPTGRGSPGTRRTFTRTKSRPGV